MLQYKSTGDPILDPLHGKIPQDSVPFELMRIAIINTG